MDGELTATAGLSPAVASEESDTRPLLTATRLRKAFGALVAVNDVSFEVVPDEVFGIAGPNGSGKSTPFDLLTGFPFGPDQSGSVWRESCCRGFRPTASPGPGWCAPSRRTPPSTAYPPGRP